MGRTAHHSPKILIVTAVVLIVSGFGGLAWYSQANDKPAKSPPAATQQAPPAKEPTTSITYTGQDGKTALELLKVKAEVQTKSSSLGDYVTAINGNDGGGSKYWIFYINGKESAEGAGTYVTNTNETIEWKLQ